MNLLNPFHVNSTLSALPVVKVVRYPDGHASLVRIPCPNAWVLRKRFLCGEDVE